MDLSRSRLAIFVLAGSHLVNDSYGFVLAATLPALIPAHSLSLAMAGLLLATYQVTSSLLQPFIGHVADRGGLRWLAWGGLAIEGVAISMLGLAPSYVLLFPLLIIGGLGSASFHPSSAASVVHLAGPRERGRWLGLYITLGNFGLGLGPLLVGPLVERLGLEGTWLLAPAGLIAGALLFLLVPPNPARPVGQHVTLGGIFRQYRHVLLVLVLIVTFRSLATGTLGSFLPLLGSTRGLGVADAARGLTAFLAGGAAGTFAGAWASDRVGRDRVIVASLLVSIPFGLVLALHDRADLTFWLSTVLCGFFLNGSFAVLALRGQETVPGSAGMMSGLMLGMSIGLGGLGAIPMSKLAEIIGLGPTTAIAAVLPLGGAMCMRLLPGQAAPVETAAPRPSESPAA